MSLLGWIVGMLLGGLLGQLNHSPISGALIGGLIGNLFLVQSSLSQALRQAVAEIAALKTLLAQQKNQLQEVLTRMQQPSGHKPTEPTTPEARAAEATTLREAPQPAPADLAAKPNSAPAAALAEPIKPETPKPPQPAPSAPVSAPATMAMPAAPRAPSEPRPQAHRPTAPAQPALAQEPGLLARLIGAARAWLFGGNTLVRMGAVLVFLGFGFLLRYASDYVVVPIELRYLGVVGAAMAALWLGWRLRPSRPAYALLLQGVAVAVMYLSVFAAMRLHQILPPGPGMALLVCLAALSTMLALLQNAMALAVAGSLGGFAAPILASTGEGSHIALFAYIALLNASILSIAWFRAWRPLNLIGFFGTSALGSLWAARSYQPEHYLSCQLFLLLFFLMFVAIGALFARRQLLDSGNTPPAGAGNAQWLDWLGQQSRSVCYVDGSLLFGPPLVGFGLQYALMQGSAYGAAFSALILGAFYMLLAWQLFSRTGNALRLLVEVYLALGVIFASLAIPLGLDAAWTSAVWAVEAAGIYWVGLRQQRGIARAFALLLQLAASLLYVNELGWGEHSVLSGSALGAGVLGAALLGNALSLRQAISSRDHASWDSGLRPLFSTLGLGFVYLLAPLLLNAQDTAIAWSLAGLLSIVLGLRWGATAWLANGAGIQLLAGLLFLSDQQSSPGHLVDYLPAFAHAAFWVPLIIGSAAFLAAWRMVAVARRCEQAQPPSTLSLQSLSLPLMLWATVWWAWAWWPELNRILSGEALARHAFLGVMALTAIVYNRVAAQQSWGVPVVLSSGVLGLAGLCFGLDALDHQAPFAHWGWLAAALCAAAHLYGLRNTPLVRSGHSQLIHLAGIWTLLWTLSLTSRQLFIDISFPDSAWRWLGWVLPLCAWLIWSLRRQAASGWPASTHPTLYRFGASVPLVLVLFAWVLFAAWGSAGDAAPLPYLPILNPLEVTLLLALMSSALWLSRVLDAEDEFAWLGEPLRWLLYALGFIVYSTTVLRADHHFAGLAWGLPEMLHSMLAQASLSIAWALLALALMIAGHRHARRGVWIAGAALVGVVVAKMFFIELSNRGGLERIVSFIGVGLLLLVVGYFAPLPPSKESAPE